MKSSSAAPTLCGVQAIGIPADIRHHDEPVRVRMRRDRRQLADRRVRDPVAVGDVEVLVQEHRDDVRDALVAQLLVEPRMLQGRAH